MEACLGNHAEVYQEVCLDQSEGPPLMRLHPSFVLSCRFLCAYLVIYSSICVHFQEGDDLELEGLLGKLHDLSIVGQSDV